MSLCFLLALVVLLMQRAADPRHIRNAFQALGVPLDQSPVVESPVVAPAVELPPGEVLLPDGPADRATVATAVPGAPTASPWETTCRDLVPRLLDELTEHELTELAKLWFGSAPGPEASATAVWPQAERASTILETLTENTRASAVSEPEKSAWLERLKEFRGQWQLLGDHPNRNQLPPDISPQLRTAISAYVDQRLVALLSDASPWTAAETVSFWRLLQRGQGRGEDAAHTHPGKPAPEVNTLQLTANAADLRGTHVRFRGSVRRVEFIERTYPALGLDKGYWILWLRGQDAAVQPVAVYTTDQRAAELARQIDLDRLDFPEIEVTAISAKRLAYASQTGVQVAPTLFASSVTPLEAPLSASPVAVSGAELWSQFLIAVVAACLLAAAVIIPITWQRAGRTGGKRLSRRTNSADNKSSPQKSSANNIQPKSGHMTAALLLLTAPVSLAGLLLTAVFMQSTPPLPQRSQSQPPWADTEQHTDPLQNLFTESLRNLFEPASLAELRQYQAQREGSFPDPLLKMFYAIRRISWQRALSLSEPLALSDEIRLRPRTLSGWVRLATPVFLTDSQQSWFESHAQEQIYRIELELQNDLFEPAADAPSVTAAGATNDSLPAGEKTRQLITVYCQHVPSAWLTTAQLRQPAQFTALTFEDVDRSEIPWCALASAPVWRMPPTMTQSQLAERLAPPLAPRQLALGLLGWDLMHGETVIAHHQQPLASEEADGFYSLIRLVGAAGKSASAAAEAAPGLDESPLKTLSQARASFGKEINWPVRIVSGTLVSVDNPHHRKELGAAAYIQFDGFVDIGRDRVRFQPASTDQLPADALEFEGEFPITIVSTTDTPLVPQPTLAAGVSNWNIGQYARLQGRFYRLWAFQSDAVQSRGQAARLIAPLVIAARIVPTPPPIRTQASTVGWFGWALCAATLVILGGILWSTASGLKPRKRLPH